MLYRLKVPLSFQNIHMSSYVLHSCLLFSFKILGVNNGLNWNYLYWVSGDFCPLSSNVPFIYLFLNIIFISFLNLKKILHVVNDVSHKRAKSQFEILYVLSYTKWQMCGSKYTHFQISNYTRFCHFCVAHNTKSFACL